jgi:competence ComEA-like helix-hairpin-helix protein
MNPSPDRVLPLKWQTLAALAALILIVNFISGAWSSAAAFAAPATAPEAEKIDEPTPYDQVEPALQSKVKSKKSAASKKKKATPKLEPGRQVNLNTASQAELEKIPGIGPKKAQAIIKGRPYQSPEDVMKVKGIKKGTYRKIKDSIK